MRTGVCGFRGAHFTHGFMSLLCGSDDEKERQVDTGEALLLLLLGLVVPLVKTLMSPKIFTKMQVQLNADALLCVYEAFVYAYMRVLRRASMMFHKFPMLVTFDSFFFFLI